MIAVPADVGVKVTLQLAEPVTPATSWHGLGVLKPPADVDVVLRLKVTWPVGVVVPVTVAVHKEPWLMNTGLAHETLIPAAGGGWTVIVLDVVGPLPA
jgi:hypothetical protein